MISAQVRSHEEQQLVQDMSCQQIQAIKVAATSHPLQPVGHSQLLQKKDHESQQDEDPAARSCPRPASCWPK